jgi:hypothetical protein
MGPHHLDLAVIASKPHQRDVIGLGEAPHAIAEPAPICSNTAGDAIGMPRCWGRKYTTPPGVCSFCTNPDK